MLELRTEIIKDEKLRDLFEGLVEWARLQDIFQGDFRFFEIEFGAAVTNYKYPHKMGIIPKDILQTSLTGAGAITFNYALFDATNLNITTTAACKVRFFAGNFAAGSQA